MLSSVKMLTAEIREPPVFREFADELVESFNEVFAESRVVFKDNVRVDSFEQTLFKDQQM